MLDLSQQLSTLRCEDIRYPKQLLHFTPFRRPGRTSNTLVDGYATVTSYL